MRADQAVGEQVQAQIGVGDVAWRLRRGRSRRRRPRCGRRGPGRRRPGRRAPARGAVGRPARRRGGRGEPRVEDRACRRRWSRRSPGPRPCACCSLTRRVYGAPTYWPVRPSMRSRRRSAWPQCRAYSSIMWTTISRSSTRSPSGPTSVAEVVVPLVDLAGVRDLGAPRLPGLGDHRVVGHGAVEVEVAVLRRLERPRELQVALDEPAEPVELDRRPGGAPGRAATSTTAAPTAARAARRRAPRTSSRRSSGSGRGTPRAPPSRRAAWCRCRAGRPRGRPTCRGTGGGCSLMRPPNRVAEPTVQLVTPGTTGV